MNSALLTIFVLVVCIAAVVFIGTRFITKVPTLPPTGPAQSAGKKAAYGVGIVFASVAAAGVVALVALALVFGSDSAPKGRTIAAGLLFYVGLPLAVVGVLHIARNRK